MTLNNPSAPGYNFTPAYQMSGIPYVTSSVATTGVTHISFDRVTRFLTVKNTNSTTSQINVAFTQNGLGNYHWFPLKNGESFSAELRIKDLFITCISGTTSEYSVLGGMTTINARDFPILSGSSGISGIG
jgi:hypothetical protein